MGWGGGRGLQGEAAEDVAAATHLALAQRGSLDAVLGLSHILAQVTLEILLASLSKTCTTPPLPPAFIGVSDIVE